MRYLHHRFVAIILNGHVAGIVIVTLGLVLDFSHLRVIVLGSPDPIPIFFLICAVFGSAIACVRFGYELIEQGIAERKAEQEHLDRLQNPWTAPLERKRRREED